MKGSTTSWIFVAAFCMANVLCSGQQNRSAICRLGEISNDSLLSQIETLEINTNEDISSFADRPGKFNSLSTLIIKGDTDAVSWEKIFRQIKLSPEIVSVIFDSNTFSTLPYGYEGLYPVSEISFRNNEELDLNALVTQLSELPNLRDLSVEFFTIFDFPSDLSGLKNLAKLHLTNTDEHISVNVTDPFAPEKQAISYDYVMEKPDQNKLAIRYTATAGEIDSDEYAELAKRFRVDNQFQPYASIFLPKYENVDPPIKGLDVARELYVLNPSIENIITYPSGTRIRIPANAFTDAKGNPVTETVTLSYREFRDPVDFLVSGIPMKYDTGGVITNFESAGMFEILACANKEPLQLAPDKQIDMNFVSTSKDSTYNFYAFDDKTGNWEFLEKPKTVTRASTIVLKPASTACRQFDYLTDRSRRFPDRSNLEQRFRSNKYIFTLHKTRLPSDPKELAQQRITRTVRMSRIKKLKDGTILFKMRFNPDQNPEMREFNDVFFVSSEDMKPAEFRKKYYKQAFNDIRVVQSGSELEVLLKGKQGIIALSASLGKVDSKGNLMEVKNTANRMRNYGRRLRKRDKEFCKGNNKYWSSDIIIDDSLERCKLAYPETEKYMTAAEKAMTFDEWLNYVERSLADEKRLAALSKAEQLANLQGMEANASNLVQSLSLSGMGIYNCDQIQRMENPVEIFAKYSTSENKGVDAQKAYVIDKGNNSVFQYDGYRGYSANKIALDQGESAQNTLLAIAEDGSVSVYKNEEFKKRNFRNKEHVNFKVTKIDANFTTVADLRKLIGF